MAIMLINVMEDIDDLILNVVDYITKEWCRSIVVNKFENINFDKRKRKSHLLLQVYLGGKRLFEM